MATTVFDLSGQVAIVTGGSRGLGLEMATGLGEAGARVAITARREAWLGPAETQLAAQGIEVVALQADVSRPDHAESVVRQVLDRFGRLDLLVNNAGISWGAPAESMPLDRWLQVMAVNVTGAFLMAQAALSRCAGRAAAASSTWRRCRGWWGRRRACSTPWVTAPARGRSSPSRATSP